MISPYSIFKAVIVHENTVMADHALVLLNKLATQLRNDLGITTSCWEMETKIWQFDWLKNTKSRELAVAGAAEAGMIVISTGNTNSLPIYVRDWIENVLHQMRGKPVAVVALLPDQEVSPAYSSLSPNNYLQRVAEKNDAHFFCNLEWTRVRAGIQTMPSRMEDDAGRLQTSIARYSGFEGWGINE